MLLSKTKKIDAPITIAVVGGGIGGLSLAIGLLGKTNLKVQLYEAASKFSEIGAGVALGPNAQRALRLISPEAEAAYLSQNTKNLSPGFEDSWFEFRRGTGFNSGEILANIRNQTGQSTVHRAKFLDELVKLVPQDIVHFGKRLKELQDDGPSEGVTLYFQDGTSATADCVVGADGVNSAVRKFLLGSDHPSTKPRFTGIVAYRGLVPMDVAREKLGKDYTDDSRMWCGDNGMVMTYPIDHGSTLNIVASRDGRKSWDAPTSVIPATREECRAAFADWDTKARDVIELLDYPTCWALFEHPHAPYYNLGQVAVIGDAAHCTTPFQGAGAGQAIEDALVMATILQRVREANQIQSAFAAYDEVRRQRSQRVVDTSKEAGRLYAFSDDHVRGDTDKFRSVFESRMSWLWNIDLRAQNVQALNTFDKLRRRQDGRATRASGILAVWKPLQNMLERSRRGRWRKEDAVSMK